MSLVCLSLAMLWASIPIRRPKPLADCRLCRYRLLATNAMQLQYGDHSLDFYKSPHPPSCEPCMLEIGQACAE